MVDYISEAECYHMFNYFDKNMDGFLDFADFLTLVLPSNDLALRAKVSQRQNYAVGPEDRLQSNVEFELSRLIEKEIHYHVKTEIEKKQLEAMEDFNGVGVFSTLDTLNYGYLDFENIKNFLFKFKQEIMKEDVNSIIRRWSDHPDGKISFREFSLGITPELAGLSKDAARTDFNSKAKQRLEEENAARGYAQVNASEHKSLRSFRNISGQGHESPMRQEFK